MLNRPGQLWFSRMTTAGVILKALVLTLVTIILLVLSDLIFGGHHLRTLWYSLTLSGSWILLGIALSVPFFVFGELFRWSCLKMGLPRNSFEDVPTEQTRTFLTVRSVTRGYIEEVTLRGGMLGFSGVFIDALFSVALALLWGRAWPYAMRAFVYGCILGAVYVTTGNLWVAVMMHCGSNFLETYAPNLVRDRLPAL